MRVDGSIDGVGLGDVAERVRDLEELGYDGLTVPETSHDPFLALTLAAEHSRRLDLATSIAVAFPRSPVHLAHLGHDLQVFSGGRFALGLGSQVRAHIEKRFGTPWSRPAARMRELILAVKAVWRCWNEGEKLDFRGDFYTHTLMTPFFSPRPSPHGPPRVLLAAVGTKMTEVAGEVADGLMVHPLNTARYLSEVTLPAVERGRALVGKTGEGFELSAPVFIVAGESEEAEARAAASVRSQIAFYASTPNYRGILELHGWGGLAEELNLMSKQGRWSEMGDLIDEDMLEAFAIRAPLDQVAARLEERFGTLLERVSFYAPYVSAPGFWAPVIAGLGNERARLP